MSIPLRLQAVETVGCVRLPSQRGSPTHHADSLFGSTSGRCVPALPEGSVALNPALRLIVCAVR